MKITWFSGTTFRVYFGGDVFVSDPEHAPPGLDIQELTAAATIRVNLSRAGANNLPKFDAGSRRQPARRIIDDLEPKKVEVLSLAPGSVIFVDDYEPNLLLVSAEFRNWGRLADGAIIVIYGAGAALMACGVAALERARPKLLALAVSDDAELELGELAGLATDSAIQVLDEGQSIEV